jgi:hypothetical protein
MSIPHTPLAPHGIRVERVSEDQAVGHGSGRAIYLAPLADGTTGEITLTVLDVLRIAGENYDPRFDYLVIGQVDQCYFAIFEQEDGQGILTWVGQPPPIMEVGGLAVQAGFCVMDSRERIAL